MRITFVIFWVLMVIGGLLEEPRYSGGWPIYWKPDVTPPGYTALRHMAVATVADWQLRAFCICSLLTDTKQSVMIVQIGEDGCRKALRFIRNCISTTISKVLFFLFIRRRCLGTPSIGR